MVTKEEIDEYIKDDLESYNQIVDVTDRDYVKVGDYVNVSFKVYYNNEIVNEVENEAFVVSKNIYNEQIESNLIGRKRC